LPGPWLSRHTLRHVADRPLLPTPVGHTHPPRMPSPWCAWCGKPVSVGVIVAGVVTYHEFCWARRARLVGLEAWRSDKSLPPDPPRRLVRARRVATLKMLRHSSGHAVRVGHRTGVGADLGGLRRRERRDFRGDQ